MLKKLYACKCAQVTHQLAVKLYLYFFSTISKIKLGYPGRRRGRWVLAPSSGTLPRQISGCNTARRLKSLEYHLGFYGLLSKRSPTNCRFDETHSFLSWFFSCNAHRCSVENRKYCRRHITSVRPPPHVVEPIICRPSQGHEGFSVGRENQLKGKKMAALQTRHTFW